jgi:ABC-type branched-subunit amino acid transport system permease subunit
VHVNRYNRAESRWYAIGRGLLIAGSIGQILLGYAAVCAALIYLLQTHGSDFEPLHVIVVAVLAQAPATVMFGWAAMRLTEVVREQY